MGATSAERKKLGSRELEPVSKMREMAQLPKSKAASGADALISRPFDFESKTVPLAVTENDHF